MTSTARQGASQIHVRMLRCGMPLLVEEMPGVRTAAVSWLLPAGNASDPEGEAGDGWSSLLAELAQRGAGSRDSRAYSDALDRAGVQRAVSKTPPGGGSPPPAVSMASRASCSSACTASASSLDSGMRLPPQ